MLPDVVLYTRRGCHLCDEVKLSLGRLSGRAQFRLREVDIDSDPELVRQFNDEVPVVFVNGTKAFTGVMQEEVFLKLLPASD